MYDDTPAVGIVAAHRRSCCAASGSPAALHAKAEGPDLPGGTTAKLAALAEIRRMVTFVEMPMVPGCVPMVAEAEPALAEMQVVEVKVLAGAESMLAEAQAFPGMDAVLAEANVLAGMEPALAEAETLAGMDPERGEGGCAACEGGEAELLVDADDDILSRDDAVSEGLRLDRHGQDDDLPRRRSGRRRWRWRS